MCTHFGACGALSVTSWSRRSRGGQAFGESRVGTLRIDSGRAWCRETTALASYACMMSDLGFSEAVARFHEVNFLDSRQPVVIGRGAGGDGSPGRNLVPKAGRQRRS